MICLDQILYNKIQSWLFVDQVLYADVFGKLQSLAKLQSNDVKLVFVIVVLKFC